MMKKTSTAAFTLALSFATPTFAGNCFLRSTCAPKCVTAPACPTEVTSCSSVAGGMTAHDMGGMDNPSELNVALTTELVALRDEVAAANQSLEEKDAAIAEANEMVASLEEQIAALKADVAAQTERAEKAEKQSANVRKLAIKTEEDAQQRLATLEKEMEAQTGALKKELTSTKSDLDKANAALEEERKKREEEQRQQEQKATPAPVVQPKEDEAAAAEGDQEPTEGESED